jgi:hypothetical protein
VSSSCGIHLFLCSGQSCSGSSLLPLFTGCLEVFVNEGDKEVLYLFLLARTGGGWVVVVVVVVSGCLACSIRTVRTCSAQMRPL